MPDTTEAKHTTESPEASNTRIALALSEAIMHGQWDTVDTLISDDFVYIADGRAAIGKMQYIGFMKNVLCTAMSDMDMHFLRIVTQNDMVAVDYSNHMTHSGEFFGIPATGKRLMGTGQFMRQIRNGQVCAEWQTTNAAGLMQQLTSTI